MIKHSLCWTVMALAASTAPVYAAPVTVVEVSEVDGSVASSVRQGPLSAQNEMVFMLQQLQDEVRTLRGIVEQQQYRLEQLDVQQRDRYRDMDRRISVLLQALPDTGVAVAGAAAAVSELSGAAASGAVASDPVAGEQAAAVVPELPAAASAPSSQSQAAYDAAFAQVRQRDFAAAEAAFKAFLRDYPDSPLQANAWYWLGEVYLAQQKSAESRTAFTRVIEQFTTHTKAADALYKLGVLAGREGDAGKARQLMQRVVQTYPQSSAADLARGYLKP
ncbi:tol-pal system protein YbgF [Marinobacterium halophilum]|nr:tol-pal system protein YbgF [Marinobacterium halophilum]